VREPTFLTPITLPRPVEFFISYLILLPKSMASALLTLDLILLPKPTMFVFITLPLSDATPKV